MPSRPAPRAGGPLRRVAAGLALLLAATWLVPHALRAAPADPRFADLCRSAHGERLPVDGGGAPAGSEASHCPLCPPASGAAAPAPAQALPAAAGGAHATPGALVGVAPARHRPPCAPPRGPPAA
jgi:hypothetical protein